MSQLETHYSEFCDNRLTVGLLRLQLCDRLLSNHYSFRSQSFGNLFQMEVTRSRRQSSSHAITSNHSSHLKTNTLWTNSNSNFLQKSKFWCRYQVHQKFLEA